CNGDVASAAGCANGCAAAPAWYVDDQADGGSFELRYFEVWSESAFRDASFQYHASHGWRRPSAGADGSGARFLCTGAVHRDERRSKTLAAVVRQDGSGSHVWIDCV